MREYTKVLKNKIYANAKSVDHGVIRTRSSKLKLFGNKKSPSSKYLNHKNDNGIKMHASPKNTNIL